jgi:hypothetical protein
VGREGEPLDLLFPPSLAPAPTPHEAALAITSASATSIGGLVRDELPGVLLPKDVGFSAAASFLPSPPAASTVVQAKGEVPAAGATRFAVQSKLWVLATMIGASSGFKFAALCPVFL